MWTSRFQIWQVKSVLSACISLFLLLVPLTPIALACEGAGGPRVKVEPKMLNFREKNAGEKEELILTYTNEGPGEWEPTEFKFAKVRGELGAWGVRLGAISCMRRIAVGRTCEEIVSFEPQVAGAGEIEANVTTNPVSETVVAKGKGK